MEPKFFPDSSSWRKWLERNHASKTELLVGFYKRGSGQPSITWPESVDEALCFGWIDGVRRSIDAASYTIRFTPRKPRSTWSAVNIKRVGELTAAGLMRPAGLQAFEQRREAASVIYAYEQGPVALSPEQLLRFQANPKAWEYFQSRPPWYRRTATWWVISAKREETREKRMAILIEDSEQGRSIGPLAR